MKFWPRALTARILLVELLAIMVVIVLLPSLTISLLHRTMTEYQGALLTNEAAQITRAISVRDGAVRVQLPTSLAQAYASAYDGRSYAVIDRSGRILASNGVAALVPASRAPRETRDTVFRSAPYIGLSDYHAGSTPFWIIVSQNEARPGAIVDDIADAFLWRYLALLVAALALLPLVNALLIRRLTFAVRRVSARAADIGPANLDTRLDEANMPTEVIDLVRATNTLIGRLQQSFAQQREFIANLVHELRTPLATLKMQLDGAADPNVRQQMSATVDRVSHVMSQLRDLAALETLEEGERGAVDLCVVTRQTVAAMAPAVYAAGDHLELEAASQPVLVGGREVLIRLALENLVRNASQHTPSGTTIRVRVGAGRSISVSDNGPGLAINAEDHITRRFWRASQQRSDTAGLGLSIVDRIVKVHGGEMEVFSTPGKGTRFRLIFPPFDGDGWERVPAS